MLSFITYLFLILELISIRFSFALAQFLDFICYRLLFFNLRTHFIRFSFALGQFLNCVKNPTKGEDLLHHADCVEAVKDE